MSTTGKRLGGRGTTSNPAGRFERLSLEPEPDGEAAGVAATQFFRDASRALISRNDSPDVPFGFTINPYRGCEHGCIYCYARPYHEYLGLSAGLDFETKIFVKEEAPDILRRELARRSWTGQPIGLCGVTDGYQPVERRLGLTRRCLEVIAGCRQPIGIVTKSPLVARDADILEELAKAGAAHAWLTVTTLDEGLRRAAEPRAATTERRLEAVACLAERGVPVGVMVSPVIPGLTEHEVPKILARAKAAGARFAEFTLLRLPHGTGALFDSWLSVHRPGEREKVLGRLRQLGAGCRGGAAFGTRLNGRGPLAVAMGQLFDRARERCGLAAGAPALSSSAFRRPLRPCPLFE